MLETLDADECEGYRWTDDHGLGGALTMSRASAPYEPATRMSREAYRAWAEQQGGGRYERINGVVVAMAPERIAHARVKARAWRALDRAIRMSGAPCEALPDGITVEIDDCDYEPDAVVQCGPLDPKAVAADNPVVIVEVLSPSTSSIDRAWKLQEYFKLSSLKHYLIIWADQQQVAHHRRGEAGDIETRTAIGGEISLDPPGLRFTVEELYAA